MKRFFVLTLFPDMIDQIMSHSILGRAAKNGLICIETVNIRDFSHDKHRHVDDYSYGGGAGMILQAQPVYDAYQSILDRGVSPQKVIYMSPQGVPFCQPLAETLAEENDLIFLCGHYEGIDERVIEEIVTDQISLGDFVLTGGELACAAMIDAISRLIPGVLGKEASYQEESFHDNLLEYPQYTRPEEFMGRKVPEVLLSGHHEKIAAWRREQSLIRTAAFRPDLLEKANLTSQERDFLKRWKDTEKSL